MIKLEEALKFHYQQEADKQKQAIFDLAAEIGSPDRDTEIAHAAMRQTNFQTEAVSAEKRRIYAEQLQKEGYPGGDLETIYRVLSDLILRDNPQQITPHFETPEYTPDIKRGARGRAPFEHGGVVISIGETKQLPIAQKLQQNIGKIIKFGDFAQEIYGDNNDRTKKLLANEISKLRGFLSEGGIDLDIIGIKGEGYMMLPKGEKIPERLNKSEILKPEKELFDFKDTLKLLDTKQIDEQGLNRLLDRSTTLVEGVHFERIGNFKKRRLFTPEGIELLKNALETVRKGKLTPGMLDKGIVAGKQESKDQKMSKGRMSVEKTADKLQMSSSTVNTILGVEGLMLEGIHFNIESKGGRNYTTITDEGYKRIKFINETITKGKRLKGNTIRELFDKWLQRKGERKGERKGSTLPKGEMAWGLVKPLTVQEEAKLALKFIEPPEGVMEKYKITFNSKIVGEARTIYKEYSKIRDNFSGKALEDKLNEKVLSSSQITESLQKKLLSLAQNPYKARVEKFSNTGRTDYYNMLMSDMLLILETFSTKTERQQFIIDFFNYHPDYNGTHAHDILNRQ